PLEPCDPNLVVGFGKILCGMQAFARRARLVDVPGTDRAHCQRERKGASLPEGMEHRFARLGTYRPKAHHSAHVLRAVQECPSGALGNPVPIMLSRVTRLASSSSLHPSVPGGRSGTTR